MGIVDVFTIFGVVSTGVLSTIALMRTLRQDKKNLAAKNLDEIFTGNQKLLQNYSDDNKALRKRVTDLEADLGSVKLEMQQEIDGLVNERNELSHKLLKSQSDNARLIAQIGGVNG